MHLLRRTIEGEREATPPIDDPGILDEVREELSRLRESNDELKLRLRRLEARSGRGLPHPLDYIDLSAGEGG
jgi:hypothetical protein